MKPLIIILKTLIIGYLWSIIFIDGIRVVLLINWHFDIFLKEHWGFLSEKWNSGTPMTNSELGFFMIIGSSIPLWFAGWVGLCLVKWEVMIKRVFLSPLYLYRKMTLKTRAPVVIKKKSITEEVKSASKTPIIKKTPLKKQVLPSVALMQSNINNNLSPAASAIRGGGSSFSTPSKKNPEMPVNHALFNFDEDDFDLDFDFDKNDKNKLDAEESIPSALVVSSPAGAEKEKIESRSEQPKNNRQQEKQNNKKENQSKNKQATSDSPLKESHTPVLDVLVQKGYDVISSAIIKGTTIDYIGVSKNQLLICYVDKEIGDWLADEEKFNDEEPLWFSESSHRISPVRQVDIARDILKTKLAISDMNYDIVSYVVIQTGNIINAEDMFEVWSNMNINVTRINRGSPKEIRLFSKTLENCEEKVEKNTLEKLKKLIRSLA